MTRRTRLCLVLAIVAVGVATATAKVQQTDAPEEKMVWEYAQLRIDGNPFDETNTAIAFWNTGGQRIPRGVSVGTLINQLSKRNRQPTMVNLLNEIGDDGWELVNVQELGAASRSNAVWTFIRKE